MIQRIKNKSLIEDIKKYDIVLLMMNINNSMFDGFLNDIAINFPSVKEKEIKSGYGDKRKYGDIFLINDFIPFYACYVIRKGHLDETCLEQSLEKVSQLCKGKKVASILVGSEEIYEKYFKDVELYLYDDVTIGSVKKLYWKNRELREQLKQKLITKEEFEEKYNKIQWERFHGIYNNMPEGWKYNRKKDNNFRIE